MLGLGNAINKCKSSGVTGLLLDGMSPLAVFSFRYLLTDWIDGNVVRIRRSSDNAEQDFTATEVTDGTMLSFVGAGDGFATTWYDQSGNGNDAIQTTASLQPKLVSSGVIETLSSLPALLFDGTGDRLTAGSAHDFSSGFSVHSVVDIDVSAGATNQYMMSYQTSNTNGFRQQLLDTTNSANTRVQNTNALAATSSVAVYGSVSSDYDNSTIYTYFNSDSTSQALTSSIVTSATLQVGSSTGASAVYMKGKMQELIIFNSSKYASISDIRNNVNTYYTIY